MSGPAHADTSASPPAIPDHELVRCIGGGAYGEVWLARNVLGELRAVKIIHRSRFSDPRPFEREFEGIQRFEPISRSHPSQLAILHVGKNDAAGCFYYVMELADAVERQKDEGRRQKSGESTECAPDSVTSSFSPRTAALPYVPRTLRHDLEQQSRLPAPRVLELGLALAEALAHLHSHGLVHRDIKPSNIIFVNSRPKLADIGLVTDASDQCSIVGTEGYLAPEGPGAPPADIFALGKVLYEALTGLDRRRYPEVPAEVRDWPDRALVFELNEIILKACAADVHQRYANADAMLADLRHLVEGRSLKRRRTLLETGRLTMRFGAVAAVGFAAWMVSSRFNASPPQQFSSAASIFVLPFRDDGTNKVDALLRSRVTDAIRDGLELIEGIKVGPHKSGWAERDEAEVRQLAAKQFGARYTLSARVKETSDNLCVTVTLHDGSALRPTWTQSFTITDGDLIALEDRIIRQVATKLDASISPQIEPNLQARLTRNRAAHSAYQDWREQIRRRDRLGFAAAVERLNAAIQEDPRFVEAYTALAFTYRINSEFERSPREMMPEVRKHAALALQIDDTCDQARHWLWAVRLLYEYDWDGAEVERANPAALKEGNEGAMLLRMKGRFAEARQVQERALALAPRDQVARNVAIGQFLVARRYVEALKFFQETKELFPETTDYYGMLPRIYEGLGEYGKAIDEIRRRRLIADYPLLVALLGRIQAKQGNHAAARTALAELDQQQRTGRFVSPYFVAWIHAALGDKEQVLKHLERAYEERSELLVQADDGGLRTDPAWDGLREEPRFSELLKKVGLDQWPK
jgi:serine/threonine protein kinase/tetratricopeptide (TPR) repeat protein